MTRVATQLETNSQEMIATSTRHIETLRSQLLWRFVDGISQLLLSISKHINSYISDRRWSVPVKKRMSYSIGHKIRQTDHRWSWRRRYWLNKQQLCSTVDWYSLKTGINVARSTLRFDTIQLIFGKALDNLRKRIASSSKNESILSSIIKVEKHYYGDPRREGHRFKLLQTWIDTGAPVVKHRGFNRRRGGIVHKAGGGDRQEPIQRHKDDSRTNPYSRSNPYERRTISNNRVSYERRESIGSRSSTSSPYRQPGYSKMLDQHDHNSREYERHKRNNNTHLAEHYREKSERSQKKRRYRD